MTGNPGRPVVSSVNYHTYTISKYVDFHLQPIVKNIPSYVRDTTDFLQKLDKLKKIPNDCLLVTLNVKSLYTNIANNEGVKAVREAYDHHPNKTVATKVIITFLSLILTLNKLVFNSINYLQIMGCAMVQSVLQHTQILSWHNLKSNIYIPTLKINQYYTYDISMIYS